MGLLGYTDHTVRACVRLCVLMGGHPRREVKVLVPEQRKLCRAGLVSLQCEVQSSEVPPLPTFTKTHSFLTMDVTQKARAAVTGVVVLA